MDTKMLDTLIKAIPLRYSVRNFQERGVEQELLEQLKAFVLSLAPPFDPDTDIRFFNAAPGKKLYNNGINPLDNIALIGQTDPVSVSKAGFAGQLVMLYAVSLGLSTCWFGHYKTAEVLQYFPDHAGDEAAILGYGYKTPEGGGRRIICCIPTGYETDGKKRFIDVVARKNGTGRKPLETLFESQDQFAACPQDIRGALELAKLAPSAANSQMWRFGYNNQDRTLTVSKPVGYKHFKWEHPDVDIGICAAQIWLSLLNAGYKPSVTVRQDADRAFWTFALDAS